MPGITIRNKGENFKNPARSVAACACAMDFAASALCTITCWQREVKGHTALLRYMQVHNAIDYLSDTCRCIMQ
jgi:hypothetical protein